MTYSSVANQASVYVITPCRSITLQCQADHRGQIQTSFGSVESLRKRREFKKSFESSCLAFKTLETVGNVFYLHYLFNSLHIKFLYFKWWWCWNSREHLRVSKSQTACCILWFAGFIFTIYWFYSLLSQTVVMFIFRWISQKYIKKKYKKRTILKEACYKKIKLFWVAF